MDRTQLYRAQEERFERWARLFRSTSTLPVLLVGLDDPVQAGHLRVVTAEGLPDQQLADLLEGAAAMIRAGVHELG